MHRLFSTQDALGALSDIAASYAKATIKRSVPLKWFPPTGNTHLLLLLQQRSPFTDLNPNLTLQLGRACSSSGSNARGLVGCRRVLALLCLQVCCA